MGHFSHNCKLSGLPITGGTEVALIVMKPNENLWDNSEKKLKQYGKTYMCSNDGTRFKYTPVWFPIRGKYDDYGGIEEIVEDDNTKILEEFYGLSIDKLLAIVTSGRKDDGYDDSLKIIKKAVQRPADQLEGEKHFDYYQRIMSDPMPFDGHYPQTPNNKHQIWRDGKYIVVSKEEYDVDFKLIHDHYARYNKWKESNPDVQDDYGKPDYEERYKELLTYSGMWVHGEVYDKLTEGQKNCEYGGLEFGRPELLTALGFVEGEKTKAERYNRPFTHGNLTVMSDGNWMEGSIYNLSEFKKLAKSKGETIDFSPIENKGRIEQIYDIVIPTLKDNIQNEKAIDVLQNGSNEELMEIYELTNKEIPYEKFVMQLIKSSFGSVSREESELYYYFLNTGGYSTSKINNPLTKIYIDSAKAGKIKNNLVRFWRFDDYMYACGRYYEIVGTSPQDGAHSDVQTVLNISKTILDKHVKAYQEEYGDEEDC